MTNIITYKGYAARVEYDDEDGILFGQIAGIRDGVGFSSIDMKGLIDSPAGCVLNFSIHLTIDFSTSAVDINQYAFCFNMVFININSMVCCYNEYGICPY